MGRDSYSCRDILEHCVDIKIQDIQVPKALREKHCQGEWEINYWRGDEQVAKGRAAVVMHDPQLGSFIEFKYHADGRDYHYRQDIVRIPAHYGGHRYYFQCCMSRGSFYCGRRVKTLYFTDTVYACRHCLRLVYLASRLHRDRVEYSERGRALEKRAERYRRNSHPRIANRLLWKAENYYEKDGIAAWGRFSGLSG